MTYISFSFSPRTIGTVRVLAADSLGHLHLKSFSYMC